MRINFFLTEPTYKIVGGYKMVYIYANYFANEGYEVKIYYRTNLRNFKEYIKLPMRFLLTKLPIPWFDLNKKVKRAVFFKFDSINIRNEDINIIAASTLVKGIWKVRKNSKNIYHFIQDYDKWAMSIEELDEVFLLKTKKIVVSQWLYDIVSKFDNSVKIVSNGVDLSKYFITKEIEKRDDTIMMLYHTDARKGIDRGIAIIEHLKKDIPTLKCIMFGSPKRGNNIPKWIEYYRNADSEQLRKLYNRSSVFLTTSYYEGFGLTGLESLACGCTLVSTDTMGIREYANEKTALLSSPNDNEELYNNLKIALLDKNLRVTLTKNFLMNRERYSQNLKNKEFFDVVLKFYDEIE